MSNFCLKRHFEFCKPCIFTPIIFLTSDLENLSFIGAGNVVWHLAPALEAAGHSVCEIAARNANNATEIVRHLCNARIVNSLDFSRSRAGVFVIAVPDGIVPEIALNATFPPGAIVCHTSGTLPLSALKRFPKRGVFYPLQTFTKGRPLDLSAVPFCIEAADEATEKQLLALARSVSQSVCRMDSEQRKTLHLAAVFAGNFTNHLLAVSKRIAEENNLPFDLLKPLVGETVAKALAAQDPAAVQTGPAVRRDEQTIKRHLQALQKHTLWRKIYRLLTESIQGVSPR